MQLHDQTVSCLDRICLKSYTDNVHTLLPRTHELRVYQCFLRLPQIKDTRLKYNITLILSYLRSLNFVIWLSYEQDKFKWYMLGHHTLHSLWNLTLELRVHQFSLQDTARLYYSMISKLFFVCKLLGESKKHRKPFVHASIIVTFFLFFLENEGFIPFQVPFDEYSSSPYLPLRFSSSA